MVKALVVRFFYIVIAIFSVAMIFLASSDPYFSEQFKRDFSISNMQINDIVDYEINATVIYAKYEADELNRYEKRDEFLNFRSNLLRDNLSHKLSSKRAVYEGDDVKFIDDVRYENNESLKFTSDFVTYNKNSKMVVCDSDFVITKGGDKVVGKNLIYDINNKQTKAKGVRAWIEQER